MESISNSVFLDIQLKADLNLTFWVFFGEHEFKTLIDIRKPRIQGADPPGKVSFCQTKYTLGKATYRFL